MKKLLVMTIVFTMCVSIFPFSLVPKTNAVSGQDLNYAQKNGCLPSPIKNWPKINTAQLATELRLKNIDINDLPATVDLSRYLPPVHNQGNQGSCVGWAVGYYYKTFQEGKEHKWDLTKQAHQFSPAFIYNQINQGKDEGMDYGTNVVDALELLVKQGCPTHAVFPYDENDFLKQPTSEQSDLAKAFKIKSFANFFQGAGNCTDNTIKDMKQWLANGDAIVFSLKSFNKFKYAFNDPGYVVPPPDPSEIPCPGHAILAVGYNDNLYYTDENGVKHYGAFKFVNSKGTDYGYRGFVNVSYDYIKSSANDAWCMTDTTDPKDFTIGLTPVKQYVMIGNTIDYTLTLDSLSNFKGNISLSLSNLPDGISVALNKNQIFLESEEKIQITLKIDNKVLPGVYDFAINANSNNVLHKVIGIAEVKPVEGLLIHVKNLYGEPAADISANCSTIPKADTTGCLILENQPAKTFLSIYSADEHIGVIQQFTVPGEYTLDPTNFCPVNLSARRIDGTILPAYFLISKGRIISMKFSPSTDTVFIPPGTYNIVAAAYKEYYYLAISNIVIQNIGKPQEIIIDASSLDTGILDVTYDKKFYHTGVNIKGEGYSYYSFNWIDEKYWQSPSYKSSDTKFILTTGSFTISYYIDIFDKNIPEGWLYSFDKKEEISIVKGVTKNFTLGKTISGVIAISKNIYSPGENIKIKAWFEDDTGGLLSFILHSYKMGTPEGKASFIPANIEIRDADSNIILKKAADPPSLLLNLKDEGLVYSIPAYSKYGDYEITASVGTGPLQGVVSASYSFRVGKDTVKPDLILTSPSDGSTVDQASITVSGTAIDSESGIDKVTVNSSAVSVASNGSFSKSVNLTEGTNTITIIATDKAGNTVTKTISVTYKKTDKTPPALYISSPSNYSTVETNSIVLKGTVTDEAGIDKVTVNGSEVSVASNGSFSKTVYLTKGTNTITVIATDKSGNKTEKTITVTYRSQIIITLQPDNPYMTVNDVSQEIDPGRGTTPVIIPKWSRTVIPIRAIVEALGGTISWDPQERKVTINFNYTTIYLWIDNPQAEVNGETKWIDPNNHDVRPIIRNDRTMLPLRFVAESLGCTVDWNDATKAITITYTP